MKLPRFLPLDLSLFRHKLRRKLNALRGEAVSRQVRTGPGLDYRGGVLAAPAQDTFWARVSGGANPYHWQEVIPGAGGTWVDGPRSGSDGYEVNGVHLLDGSRVELHPTGHDYRFQDIRRGTCTGRQFCTLLRDCDGTAAVGATVTLTGPGGFSDSCTTDGSGRCCIALPADSGTYHVSGTDGVHTASSDVFIGSACRTYSWYGCLGDLTKLCVVVRRCGLFPAGDPMVGATVEIDQGGTEVVSGVTDSAGEFCTCLPAVPGTVTVTPPCPYLPVTRTIPAGVPCGVPTKLIIVPPLDTGYVCACNNLAIPVGGYTVSTPCGDLTLSLLQNAFGTYPYVPCLGVSSDAIAYFTLEPCGYYPAVTALTHISGSTGMLFDELGCDHDGNWSLRISWGVQAWQNCAGWVYGYPPGHPDGCWDFTLIGHDPGAAGGVYFYNVTVRVPLTGTVTDTSVSLTGTLGDFYLPPGAGLGFPGMWVSPPCTGSISVTRSWC